VSKHHPAELAYVITSRADKPPRVGDSIQLGRTEYVVTALRLRVELRAVRDDESDDAEDETS